MSFRKTLYQNKIIQKREEDKALETHKEHLKNVRPFTGDVVDFVSINNKKK